MIQGLVQSTLANQLLTVDDIKTELRSMVKDKVMDVVMSQVPSPEELIKIAQTAANNSGALELAEKTYNKLKQLCERLVKMLEDFKARIEKNIDRIEIAENLVDLVNRLADALRPLLQVLQIVVPIISAIVIAASTGPLASGATIDKAQKSRDKAISLANTFVTFLNVFVNVIPPILNDLGKYKEILKAQLVPIDERIAYLKSICDQLDSVWAQIMAMLSIPSSQDTDIDDVPVDLESIPGTGTTPPPVNPPSPYPQPEKVSEQYIIDLGKTNPTGYTISSTTGSISLEGIL